MAALTSAASKLRNPRYLWRASRRPDGRNKMAGNFDSPQAEISRDSGLSNFISLYLVAGEPGACPLASPVFQPIQRTLLRDGRVTLLVPAFVNYQPLCSFETLSVIFLVAKAQNFKYKSDKITPKPKNNFRTVSADGFSFPGLLFLIIISSRKLVRLFSLHYLKLLNWSPATYHFAKYAGDWKRTR